MSKPHESPSLVPELYVSDIGRSVTFYTSILGFSVVFARPEDRFVYLAREGSHIMLEQPRGRTFLAGKLTYPYGLGMNLMITVHDVRGLFRRVESAGVHIVLELEDKWYRQNERLLGNRQFVVQDPDG